MANGKQIETISSNRRSKLNLPNRPMHITSVKLTNMPKANISTYSGKGNNPRFTGPYTGGEYQSSAFPTVGLGLYENTNLNKNGLSNGQNFQSREKILSHPSTGSTYQFLTPALQSSCEVGRPPNSSYGYMGNNNRNFVSLDTKGSTNSSSSVRNSFQGTTKRSLGMCDILSVFSDKTFSQNNTNLMQNGQNLNINSMQGLYCNSRPSGEKLRSFNYEPQLNRGLRRDDTYVPQMQNNDNYGHFCQVKSNSYNPQTQCYGLQFQNGDSLNDVQERMYNKGEGDCIKRFIAEQRENSMKRKRDADEFKGDISHSSYHNDTEKEAGLYYSSGDIMQDAIHINEFKKDKTMATRDKSILGSNEDLRKLLRDGIHSSSKEIETLKYTSCASKGRGVLFEAKDDLRDLLNCQRFDEGSGPSNQRKHHTIKSSSKQDFDRTNASVLFEPDEDLRNRLCHKTDYLPLENLRDREMELLPNEDLRKSLDANISKYIIPPENLRKGTDRSFSPNGDLHLELDEGLRRERDSTHLSSHSLRDEENLKQSSSDSDDEDLRIHLLRLKQQKIEEKLEQLDRKSKETNRKLSMFDNKSFRF